MLLNNLCGPFDYFWYQFMLYIPDYVVVGSDSGRIVILEYIAQKNIFEKVCF